MIAARIKAGFFTAGHMQHITDLGCYIPRPGVFAADAQEELSPAWYYLEAEGFDLEHIEEAEARPDPLTEKEQKILAWLWLRDELVKLGRSAPGER